VLNVCSGRATSVLDLAQTIGGVCGTPVQINHLPPRSGEIRHSRGDAARMRATLGLGEAMGLRDGIADVMRWHRAGRPGLAAQPVSQPVS
jgi:UDP-glucose 4-epimerase